MDIGEQYAFVDEYGTPDIDFSKDGASTHFILTAIIVDGARLPLLQEGTEAACKRHFQTGEMKSASVGRNDDRRLTVLTDLASLDFCFYAVVVDKRRLYEDSGLAYRGSCYKFPNSLLYRKLYGAQPDLKVTADRFGSRDFQVGFKEYVRGRAMSLFDHPEFHFIPSQEEVLLQLADFLSGALARAFDPKKKPPKAQEFLRLIADKALGIEQWPPEIARYLPDVEGVPDGRWNQRVRELAVRKAVEFVSTHWPPADDVTADQVSCLHYLLFQFRLVNPRRYVSTISLLRVIGRSNFSDAEKRYLRSQVIAKLRDSDVIIASSSKGYKIPCGVEDLQDFVGHTESIIIPMLKRLRRCREACLLNTAGELDVIAGPQGRPLRSLLKALEGPPDEQV